MTSVPREIPDGTQEDEASVDPEGSGTIELVRSMVVPRPVLQPELLGFHLLNPRIAGPTDVPLLGEAYRCWSDIWKQTFAELDGARGLPSDDFSRQDEIAALFHEWECIATASIRWVDLMNPVFRDDSYFSVWPVDAFDAAKAEGTKICIVSSFAVAIAWRRARGGPVRTLLGALLVERFLRSEADTIVATVRNDRGMNALCYHLGFRPLAREVVHHGVKVDLVAFHRKSSRRCTHSDAIEETVAALLPIR